MATQNINIVISATGGVTVVRQIKQIVDSANSAISPLKALQGVLRGMFLALGIKQLAEWADSWIAATNKINVFTKSQQETNTVLSKLYEVAQKVGQPLNAVIDLYHKLSIQSKDLGVSTADNIKFTEGINKALTIQGTSGAQAKGALLQLSQAMGTGKVKAQEYNSLLTGLPLVLLTVAKNLDGAGGSIARLTQMQRAGKLMSKDFYEAFMKGSGDLDEMFMKMTKTFEQGMTVLSNGISKYLGQLTQSLGLSNKFFDISTFISNNLETIGKVLMVVAVGIAATFAPSIITAFAGALGAAALALGRVSMLLLANPFVLIAVAVASVIAFGDAWDAGLDSLTSVKDVFLTFIDEAIAGLKLMPDLLGSVWLFVVGGAQDAFNAITGVIGKSTNDWSDSYSAFYADVGTGFAGMIMGIAKTMDAIGGLITGVVIAIARIFGGLPAVIGNVFREVYNSVAYWMEHVTNIVITGINMVRSKVGADLVDTVKFEQMKVNKDVFKNYGETISQSINDGFDAQGGYMQKKVEDLFGKAAALGKLRRKAQESANGGGVDDINDRHDPTAIAGKAQKAKKDSVLEKLKNDYRQLLDKIEPASGAILEMAKAEKILDDAEKRLGLSTEDHARYLLALKQHYIDVLDPLGKYMREMDQIVSITDADGRARERQSEFLKIQQDLLTKSKFLTIGEAVALKDKLALTQAVTVAIGIQETLMAASVYKRRAFIEELIQMQNLLNDPSSKFSQADATAKLVGDNPDLFAGTLQSLDVVSQKYKEMFEKIGVLRAMDLVDEQTAAQMKTQTMTAMMAAMMAAQVQASQIKLDMGSGDWADIQLVALSKLTAGFTTFASGASQSMGNFFTTFTDGFANSVGRAIVYSESLGEALGNVAREALASLISALIKLGIQWALNAALGEALGVSSAAAATATATAAGAATAAAWAPAATMVSLATLGANSMPAMAGIAATGAMSMAMSKMPGFSAGGYTGNGGVNDIAGFAHGQEFVVNADATRKNRGMLEAMNAGTLSAGNAGGSGGSGGGAPGATLVSFQIDNRIEVQGHGNESSADALERAAGVISQRTQADIMDSIRMGGVWSSVIRG